MGERAGRLLRPTFGQSHSYWYSYWCSSNEVSCQWVAKDTWTFKTIFEVNVTSLAAAQFDLALMGVDTAAEVLVNGQLVAQLSNAFRYSGSNSLILVAWCYQ